MSTLKAWLAVTHHAAFRLAGWAHVSLGDGALAGAVGGDRRISRPRANLAALDAVLRPLAPRLDKGDDQVLIFTAAPDLVPLAAALAQPTAEQSEAVKAALEPYRAEDPALYARLAQAVARGALRVARIPPGQTVVQDFLGSWAEVGLDKAKAAGPFTAAIPKPNLAKLAGLA
jgi:hypothetical protein